MKGNGQDIDMEIVGPKIDDVKRQFADRIDNIATVFHVPTRHLIVLKRGWSIDGCTVVGAYNPIHAIKLLNRAKKS